MFGRSALPISLAAHRRRRRYRHWRKSFGFRALAAGLGLCAVIAMARFFDAPWTTAPSAGASHAHDGVSLRVIDGDTVEIRGTGEVIRLANVDTPETGGRERCAAELQAGERATDEARRLVRNAERVTVRRTGRQDGYGRLIGFVLIDGRDLGETLINAGLARRWRGHREPWCTPSGALLTL